MLTQRGRIVLGLVLLVYGGWCYIAGYLIGQKHPSGSRSYMMIQEAYYDGLKACHEQEVE